MKKDILLTLVEAGYYGIDSTMSDISVSFWRNGKEYYYVIDVTDGYSLSELIDDNDQVTDGYYYETILKDVTPEAIVKYLNDVK